MTGWLVNFFCIKRYIFWIGLFWNKYCKIVGQIGIGIKFSLHVNAQNITIALFTRRWKICLNLPQLRKKVLARVMKLNTFVLEPWFQLLTENDHNSLVNITKAAWIVLDSQISNGSYDHLMLLWFDDKENDLNYITSPSS